MNPPNSAPAMPSRMVIINPPGSRPGINSLAMTPTIKPKKIHPNMQTFLPARSLAIVAPMRVGCQQEQAAEWKQNPAIGSTRVGRPDGLEVFRKKGLAVTFRQRTEKRAQARAPVPMNDS